MSKLCLGQKASITKRFSDEEVRAFSELSQDFNPIHLDEAYAKSSPFGQRIVHGMLVSSLFSGLLGKELPGEGTVYLGQDLKFRKPVYIDQEVTATVEIVNIREDKPIITLSAVCKNDSGETVLSGEAVVLFEA